MINEQLYHYYCVRITPIPIASLTIVWLMRSFYVIRLQTQVDTANGPC